MSKKLDREDVPFVIGIIAILIFWAGFIGWELSKCGPKTPKVGDCYIGTSGLVQVSEVRKYGLFWTSIIPINSNVGPAAQYSTFKSFARNFEICDCWIKPE